MQNLTTDLNTVISELNKFAETNILSFYQLLISLH